MRSSLKNGGAGSSGKREEIVLLIEDNTDDVAMVERAFARLNEPFQLVAVQDGQDAINYFKGEGAYKDRARYPLPVLILLDLQLPVVDGFRFLEWRRTKPEVQMVPVVVLATSSYSPDIQRAYSLGANSFVIKPVEPGALFGELKMALEYWVLRARQWKGRAGGALGKERAA